MCVCDVEVWIPASQAFLRQQNIAKQELKSKALWRAKRGAKQCFPLSFTFSDISVNQVQYLVSRHSRGVA